MKDSFGSAFMIYVFLAFVIVFVVFISLILKYAQAFKVKDRIISIIEEYEDYEGSSLSINTIEEFIEKETSYRLEADNLDGYGTCSPYYGFCIQEHGVDDYKYYTVYTFVSWEFPFFSIGGVWPIKGETRVVVNGILDDYN